MATILSIGRNIGGEPMSSTQWTAFKFEAKMAILYPDRELVFEGEGIGTWTDEDGEVTTEMAYTLILEGEAELPPRVWRYLEDIAQAYGQETIAVTVGATEFVQATERR